MWLVEVRLSTSTCVGGYAPFTAGRHWNWLFSGGPISKTSGTIAAREVGHGNSLDER